MTRLPFLCSLAPVVFAVLVFSGCQHEPGVARPFEPGAVLRDVNVADVQDPEVVAWTPDKRQVVLTGRRGGKYAVIAAYRDSASEASRSSLTEVSIMRTDGTDIWIRGNRDFDHPPTRADLVAFLTQLLGSEPRKFVFETP